MLRSRRRALRILASAALLACPACDSVFVCLDDASCAGRDGGSCEPTGFCSFPDLQCASGRRYGEFASDPYAGACVESEANPDAPAPPGATGTDDDDTDDSTAPEAGSLRWELDLGPVSAHHLDLASDGSVRVVGDDFVVSIEEGAPTWEASFGDDGAIRIGAAAATDGGGAVLAGHALVATSLGPRALEARQGFIALLGDGGQPSVVHVLAGVASFNPTAVKLDDDGTIRCTGTAWGSVMQIDGATVFTTPVGGFLLTRGRGAYLWKGSRLATTGSVFASAVDRGPNGSSLIGGAVTGAAVIGTTHLDAPEGFDGFVAFTREGVPSAAIVYGGSGDQKITHVSWRPGGYAIAGTFTGAVVLDGQKLDATADQNAFVALLDESLRVTSVKVLGKAEAIVAIVGLDASEAGIAIAGQFTDAIELADGVVEAEGTSGGFVARLDEDGEYVWSRTFASAADGGAIGVGIDDEGTVVTAMRAKSHAVVVAYD